MVQDNEEEVQTIEEVQNKEYVFNIPLDDFEPDEGGLGVQFYASMKKYEDSVAQYISETGEEETYDQLLERCIRTALHLKSKNLTKDDVIVLCSYNQKYAYVPFIASLFLKIPVASLDPTLSFLDISHLMKEVKPKILFVVPEVVETIEASLQDAGVEAELVVYGESDKYTEFSTFLEPHEDEENFTPDPVNSLDETAVIVFSSGTTGLPKGIMLSHYSLQLQGYVMLKTGNVGSVTLTYATLYWISAIVLLMSIVRSGGAKVLSIKFNPKEFWYLLDRYKVSTSFMAPSSAIAVVKAGRPDGIDTTNFLNCIIGGAAIPEKQLLELRDLFPGGFLYQAYGQTEVAGVLTIFNVNRVRDCLLLHNKPRSVGLPVPGTTCKIVDTNTGKVCGPNEQGELRVKSRATMIGYYNRDSSESYDSEGWLRTGDIFYFDEDGCFYIIDRIKEMLKYKSFHVPPAMLEQVIMSHPSVAQAVVIGIPDEEDGDHPMALIILKESTDGYFDEEEIKKFVEERVPDRMKLRGGVNVISNFPMTPSGKIRRVDLKNMVIKGDI